MAVTPSAQELAATYAIVGPDGTRAVLNDQSDPDFVGMLSDLSGLDSPEVRENASDLVEADGGLHGSFWYGRRPITATIQIADQSPGSRNAKLTKLAQATDAMRADGTITFTPTGGVSSFVKFRRQQPLRYGGGVVKEAQVLIVVADPRIYSSASNVSILATGDGSSAIGRSYDRLGDLDFGGTQDALAVQLGVTNNGSHETPPLFRVYGPSKNPRIEISNAGTIYQNLVGNPSFEDAGIGTTGWGTSGALITNAGATLSRVTAQQKYGAAALQVVTTATAGEGANYALPATLKAGVTYTFSIYLKGNAGGENVTIAIGTAATNQTQNATLTTNWQRIAVSITPVADLASPFAAIRTQGASAYTFFADAAMVSIGGAEYGDGSQPGWRWTGTSGGSKSEGPYGFVNKVPNPSFETNTTGWAASTGTLARSQSWAQDRDYSARWTVASAAATLLTTTGLAGMPVAAGQTYTFQISTNVLTNAGQFKLRVSWYDAAGALISSSDGAAQSGTGLLVLSSGALSAPATAHYAAVGLVTVGAGSVDLYADAAIFVQGNLPTNVGYFDGNSPGANWAGAAESSASFLPETTSAIVLNYQLATAADYLEIDAQARTVRLNGSTNRYSAVSFAQTDWFLLPPGTSYVRARFDSFSPGAQLKVVWRHAWI